MTWIDRIALFSGLDFAALALLAAAWLWIGWRIENPPSDKPSVSMLMADFRRDWMYHMVARQPRIVDATLIGNLRQATAFFSSATMIALGGGLALLGDTGRLAGVAEDLIQDSAPAFVWEIKLALILLLLCNAFLKFVWSHRLFGYCAVLMAAVPNEADDPLAYRRAAQAAEINITAARSFNRGLRAVYFAFAAAAWLLGALPLILAAPITVAVLWRREFASKSRKILLATSPGDHAGQADTAS